MPIYVVMSVSTLRPQFGRLLRREKLYLFCHTCQKTTSADFFAAIARIGKLEHWGARKGLEPVCTRQPREVRDAGDLVYIGLRSTSAVTGALAFGFTLGLVVTYELAGSRVVSARL